MTDIKVTPTQALSMGFDAVHLSMRPLPGRHDNQLKPSDPMNENDGLSLGSQLVKRIEMIHSRGMFMPDPKNIGAIIDAIVDSTELNDRLGIFPRALEILGRLSVRNPLWVKLNNAVVGKLYNTVPHPPQSFLGPFYNPFESSDDLEGNPEPRSYEAFRQADGSYNNVAVPHPPQPFLGPFESSDDRMVNPEPRSYAFRQADGSYNNVANPDLGRAGMPYARSVRSKATLPNTSLPDPGVVFDSILKRKGFKKHPGGMSSLIFAYASIVTHSLFRTDLKNEWKNNTSSYLDLSPLYGCNQEEQDQVRNKKEGKGLLYPDTYSEGRLSFLPPAASVLLVVFSRHHNYIAEKILKINERGTWSNPPPENATKRAIQDEEVFQTAKLINCGHFMSTIMGDYVATFLGSAEGLNWNMRAFDRIESKELTVNHGEGNHVSAEFNILYRWHATISKEDADWTGRALTFVFETHLPNFKSLDTVTVDEAKSVINKLFSGSKSPDKPSEPPKPSERPIGAIKRGDDGKFPDDALAKVLHDATESASGSYGGRHTPAALRVIEMLGIEQSRAWGLCTMNEFREWLGLKKFATFEEWNPDREIAAAARLLYGHIDNLELYTGLQAEEIMPQADGSRFSCGYTTTRAVLGDALALVRGDRFCTSDFTPANYTTWGFYDCQRDIRNGSRGAQLPKLLMRTLPRHFPWNSVYSLYPVMTPDHMRGALRRRQIARNYTFDRPKPLSEPLLLNTTKAIKTVFSDPASFNVAYTKMGYGSPLNYDIPAIHDRDLALVMHAVFPDKESLKNHTKWYAAAIQQKIEERSVKYENVAGKYIDIVMDVINPVAARAASEKWTGINLKSKKHPFALFTEKEMFDMLATLFQFNVAFTSFDQPEVNFALRRAALKTGTALGALVGKTLMEINPSIAPNFVAGLVARVGAVFDPFTQNTSYPFLKKLANSGRPVNELVGIIMGLTVGSTVNLAHATVNVIDFYLSDERKFEREDIVRLAQEDDEQSEMLLRGYVLEAMRLKPQFQGLWRVATVDAVVDQGSYDGEQLPPLQIKAGDRLRGNFKHAHLNSDDFPDPKEVNPERPLESYATITGYGFHACPGSTLAQNVITESVKAVFKLKNLRRGPGETGKLAQFEEVKHQTIVESFVQRDGTIGPWPGSLILGYDA